MSMIKIILNNKQIFLTPDYQQLIKDYRLNNALVIYRPDENKASAIVDTLLISDIEHAVLVGDPESSLALFKQTFKLIRAGGGVVFNNRNELLFIYRRKKWDLPKGKLDRGESIEQCASREVKEETGLQNLEFVRKICNTYHLYLEKEMILKETAWYLMFTEDKWLKPQSEEGIQKAIWVHKNNIRYQLANTYPAIEDIFDILLNEN